jgi:hypothetical protein
MSSPLFFEVYGLLYSHQRLVHDDGTNVWRALGITVHLRRTIKNTSLALMPDAHYRTSCKLSSQKKSHRSFVLCLNKFWHFSKDDNENEYLVREEELICQQLYVCYLACCYYSFHRVAPF